MPECDAKMLTGMTQKLLVGLPLIRSISFLPMVDFLIHRALLTMLFNYITQ